MQRPSSVSGGRLFYPSPFSDNLRNAESLIREGWALLFMSSMLDPVGPLEGHEGMKVPSDMNSLTDEHEGFVKNVAPRVDAL